MARVRKATEKAQVIKESALEVIKGRALLGPMSLPGSRKTKQPRSRGISRRAADQLMRELEEKIEESDFKTMSPRHWVAMFCWVHEAIYDVDCIEEVRAEWNTASSCVSRMLTEEFGGDEEEFLAYVQWLSKDEERVELWRRSNRKPGRRLRWRDFFFLKTKLADYRLHKARTSGIQ